MKTTALILSSILFLVQGLYGAERGEHRTSGDQKTEIVYLNAHYALTRDVGGWYKDKNLWVDLYFIGESRYDGPPEDAQFTGDIPGKGLVTAVTKLYILKKIVIGIGLDPRENSPPRQMLYFIANLENGETVFFKSEKSFEVALSTRFGMKKPPILLPVERQMKDLEASYDSRHK